MMGEWPAAKGGAPAKKLFFNFLTMAFCFAVNHGTVGALINLSSSLLGTGLGSINLGERAGAIATAPCSVCQQLRTPGSRQPQTPSYSPGSFAGGRARAGAGAGEWRRGLLTQEKVASRSLLQRALARSSFRPPTDRFAVVPFRVTATQERSTSSTSPRRSRSRRPSSARSARKAASSPAPAATASTSSPSRSWRRCARRPPQLALAFRSHLLTVSGAAGGADRAHRRPAHRRELRGCGRRRLRPGERRRQQLVHVRHAQSPPQLPREISERSRVATGTPRQTGTPPRSASARRRTS